jgi:hypothetical protein
MPDTERKQRDQVAQLKEMIRVNEENLKKMRVFLAELEKTTQHSREKFPADEPSPGKS